MGLSANRVICLLAVLAAIPVAAGVRLENHETALEIGEDACVAGEPFVGAIGRSGEWIPAVAVRGDDRALDFTLADGGSVRLLVTSFGTGWIFETRGAELKGAKELRFVRVKSSGDGEKVTLVRAARATTALREENGVLSAAVLSGTGFDQQRAALAVVPRKMEAETLERMRLVCTKEAVRKAGPWAEKLVANPGLEVPESWRPKKIAGRDFRASITDLLVGHFGGLDRLPDMTAFRHAVVSIGCHGFDVRSLTGRDFKVNADERKGPYTIADVINSSSRAKEFYAGIVKSEDMYFSLQMPVRPLVTLVKDDFGADREDFRKWRAANPRFIGFRGFSETDNDYNGYRRQVLGQAGRKVAVPEEVKKLYPITDDNTADYANFMDVAWKQMKKVYFGSDEIGGLYSIDMALGHKYAKLGVKNLEYEVAMNCVSGPWSWSGAFLRGASRQFGCTPMWYMARYLGQGAYTRDGVNRSGDQRWPRANRPAFEPYLGGGRSMNRRGYFYGWASGCSTIAVEGDCLCFLEDSPDGKTFGPSVYCREFNDIFELAEKVDRGVPYTPIALVGSQDETVSRHVYPAGRIAPYAHSAFLFTLTPVKRTSALWMSDRDKGDLGCFWNSRFGEIWDYLTCDSGQDHAAFAAALSHYPVAFLVGAVNEKKFDAKAFEDYVKNGGTLFVTADNVRRGLVEPAFAGVAYGAEKVAFKLGRYDYTAVKPSEIAADVIRFDTGFATTNLQLFTSRKVWKGRIVTCAVERYLPDVLRNPKPTKKDQPDAWGEVANGHIDFPLVRELLARVQGETIPFEIHGRCQWGVNVVESGKVEKLKSGKVEEGKGGEVAAITSTTNYNYLVWLMNNDGVRKFAGEPEEFDLDATSHVTVVNRLTGERRSVVLEPGATAFLQF